MGSYLVTPGLSSHVEPPRHPDMENIYKQNSDLVKLRESLSELRSQHLRGQNLQRLIQISSGVLVMSVVIICVLTLLTRSTTHSNTVRHRVVHSDPDWSHSLLVRKIQSTLPNPVNTLPSQHGETSQEDIFISVKTSRQFHVSRLAVILKTWFQLAKRNTFFFTDAGDSETSAASGGHLVVTSCPPDHSRQALSCKMQAEFDTFIKTSKRWFCHFDDDQYVNVPALEEKLRSFDSNQDWYLGKPSIEKPLEIIDRDSPELKKRLSFWFATGGAGFCLSRSLAERMRSHAADGKFSDVADKMRLPDDVTMGYVVELLAGVPMTKVEEFHSHLEPLRLVSDLNKQISFSYSSYGSEMNVVEVGGFSDSEDPTRFESLHCHLFPEVSWCPYR